MKKKMAEMKALEELAKKKEQEEKYLTKPHLVKECLSVGSENLHVV